MAPVLKTGVPNGIGGSNPSSSANKSFIMSYIRDDFEIRQFAACYASIHDRKGLESILRDEYQVFDLGLSLLRG